MNAIEIEQKDTGKSWKASPGDTIQVRLPENPTTGYQWEASPGQTPALRLVSSEYMPSAPASLGAGGTRTFTFQALQPGSANIQLVLRRPWEASGAKDQFTASFLVE